MFGWIVGTILAAGLQPAALEQGGTAIFEVPKASADCLIRNRGRYQQESDQLLFIYADLCPVVSPTPEQIRQAARNSGPEENPDSNTIVIERRFLACFFDRLAVEHRRSARTILRVSVAGCPR